MGGGARYQVRMIRSGLTLELCADYNPSVWYVEELLMKFVRLFFFNDTATTEIYTLSLHDALPISLPQRELVNIKSGGAAAKRTGQYKKRVAAATRNGQYTNQGQIGRAHV